MLDGQTGLLVPPGDTSALAEALLKLSNDRELAWRLGKAGQKRVKEELNWTKIGRRVHDICLETVMRHRENASLYSCESDLR